MEIITINKHYTDSSGKVLFLDATLTITQGGTSKSANSIFAVDPFDYNEDVARKRILSNYQHYNLVKTRAYNLFKIANLTETEV